MNKEDEIVIKEGEAAFYDEKDRESNPYSKNLRKFLLWNKGYDAADFEECGETGRAE